MLRGRRTVDKGAPWLYYYILSEHKGMEVDTRMKSYEANADM